MSKKALGIVLPDEWSVARLADISDVRDGTHDSPKYLESGIPFITSKNLKNGKLDFTTCNFISEEDHRKFSERSNVQNGDIIFGMIGTLGSPVIVDTDFEFSIKNVALIKFNNTQLFNQYMKYLLDSTLVQREFERISDGGVQKFISLSTIRSLQIPIPPLKEQQKIAEILSSVDAAIEKTEQVIAKTEEIKKGLMQQLLTKGIGHTEFKQTELGEIPVEWEIKNLVEVAVLTMGQSPSSEDCNEDGQGLVFFQGCSEFGDKYPIPKKYCTNPRKRASKGDILISVRAPVGDLNIAHIECAIGRGLAAIDPINIDRDYLFYYFKLYKDQWQRIQQGSTFSAINKNDLEYHFPVLYDKLPKQVIHRDVHGENMIFNENKLVGYIDFDLSQVNARIFDLCYLGTGSLATIFNEVGKRKLWLLFFKSVIKGYDSKGILTFEEKQSLKYMMYAIEMIMIAYFAREGYPEIANTNIKMVNYINSVWEN